MEGRKMIVSVVLVGLIWVFVNLYKNLVLKPKRVRSKLLKQGFKGPSPSFLYGNIPEIKQISLNLRSTCTFSTPPSAASPSHDWVAKAFPHILQWIDQYGKTFLYSTGNIQILCITDPELVKELTLQTSLNLGKPTHLSKERGALLGQGILASNGPYWAHQRKIIAPEFYLDKVKHMVTLMGNSAMTMIQSWGNKVKDAQGCAEIKVDDDLRSLSADIISRACFGCNYTQGEMIFLKLRNLQKLMSKVSVGVPGLRYLPSKINREIWRLEKEINSMILDVVKARSYATSERDLLQSILEAAKGEVADKGDLQMDFSHNRFIIDNCKNIYFAGHETTATTLSWCLMLLATNPDWQARARAEVLDICGDEVPDANMLRGMKTLTMVIQEALRLYPTVAYMVREALQDMQMKEIHIPKGTTLQIVRPVLNHNPDLWGPDVHEFKPERFSDGVNGACRVPQVYMPFGAGPRVCAGQQFAMAELKVVLSMIVSRFSFSLSPSYRHSPTMRLTVEPEHGVYLNIRKA